jgi:hypothetical protein
VVTLTEFIAGSRSYLDELKLLYSNNPSRSLLYAPINDWISCDLRRLGIATGLQSPRYVGFSTTSKEGQYLLVVEHDQGTHIVSVDGRFKDLKDGPIARIIRSSFFPGVSFYSQPE